MRTANNLLNRAAFSHEFFSSPPLQIQVDSLVGSFIRDATDWKSLAALTAGGMAYRAGRIGAMGLGGGNAARILSVGAGLTAEVSTFEWTSRGLSSLSVPPKNSNLWRWSGPQGLAQGLLQSFITFGSLKGAGRFTHGENLIVQHLFQDAAMVAGHHISGIVDPGLKPSGNIAEQFLHAEATVLRLSAGMALAHRFSPGMQALERGLDLSLSLPPSPKKSEKENWDFPFFGNLRPAFAAGVKPARNSQGPMENFNRPQILQMSRLAEENLGDEKEYFETLSEKAETDPEVLEFLQILARAQYSFAFLALAAAAESNPRGVFVLRDLALEGDSLAAMLLQNLNIAKLVHLAKTNPEAVWALRYLDEAENEQATKAMGEMELSSKPFTIPLEPMIFYPAQRPYSPMGRLEEIHRESEADPETVAFLKKLSDMGEDLATETMLTLGTRRLQETAERDLEAAYALYQLGQYGNPFALEFLRIMDVRHLLEDGGHKALTILSFAAQMGNEDAAALWFLAQKKRRGDPSD